MKLNQINSNVQSESKCKDFFLFYATLLYIVTASKR